MRQWEQRLTRRQRGVLSLVLVGIIGAAGFTAWNGWRTLFPVDLASAETPLVRPGGRFPRLPVPKGAHIVLPPGAIPAIQDPEFVPVADASARPDAPMIVVSRGGQTHVYSLHLLDGHEIVNDVLGGEPIAVTW